ncbi:hypothetical protein FA15DRAFT_709940 [Coprinopsis marcescibilis]|uniref:Uncharacterized protein n=1 Tax=Coprinopsis marcescibilis TaxID=230819 RepID=A0A5C3KEJ5_COPMA|nr:hypothetical protein FA15DRAFT_709940 [Coprinopsis marcescibilis]
MDQQAVWMAPCYGNTWSPQVNHASNAPASRIIGMKKFGEICSLMMLQQQCPHPLSPALFQFIIHGCSLDALHQGFVTEWHPELKQQLDQWVLLGPGNNISSFENLLVTYLNRTAASYCKRDEAGHRSLGPEILYHALFGLSPPYHPEFKAFISGASLSCPRSGFNFLKACIAMAHSFQGGSDAFLACTWMTQVEYSSLRSMLSISISSLFSSQLRAAGIREFFQELFHEFLQGLGVPSQAEWDAVKDRFAHVGLSSIDMPQFRSRMFVWAATGHPFLDGSNYINVTVHDVGTWGVAAINSQQLLLFNQHGSMVFQTCMRQVSLSSEYLLSLAAAPGSSGSFKSTFAHWFLTELINAIGGHSIL